MSKAMAGEIDREQPSQQISFASFHLEPHVLAALVLANQFAARAELTMGGMKVVRTGPTRPIGAFDLLYAISAVAQSGRAPSGDNSSFVALNRIAEISEVPQFAMSGGYEQQFDGPVYFDYAEPLAKSFGMMLELKREGSQARDPGISGRDLVTACLLATTDQSLQRFASWHGTSLADLQDAWHAFLTFSKDRAPSFWNKWWRAAGVPLPDERSEAPARRTIDTGRHPLADGMAPDWASGWGQDRFGVYVDFTVGAVTQRLRWIKPGRFTMGSASDEEGHFGDERPQHEVIIAEGFWFFATPVTQALYEAVTGENPSEFKGADRPVEQVSWQDAQRFMKELNERVPGLDLVLPSEAQWEYACRAGTTAATYAAQLSEKGSSNETVLDAIAWHAGNSGGETHPVRVKEPNRWGLYDMLGNVFEWCNDHSHKGYEDAPLDGSAWIDSCADEGAVRVIRGGSWLAAARNCRAAARGGYRPGNRGVDVGFRPARGQG